jgi:hypothetical protein
MLDESKKRYLEQISRPEQEARFHELCQTLGTAHPTLLKGNEPEPLSLNDFEEYEYLKKLLGFD